jgi:hypothetical protein
MSRTARGSNLPPMAKQGGFGLSKLIAPGLDRAQ